MRSSLYADGQNERVVVMSEGYYDYYRMMAEDVPWVVLFDNQVKRRARVEHECSFCQGVIMAGSVYYRTSYRDDDDGGKFKVIKHHAACHIRNFGFQDDGQ